MKQFRINIWEDGEYHYPAAYGFMPNLRAYLHEDSKTRECMLVVPGGGYCMVVPHEGEIIAKEFYNRGMNAFVLTYTTDITMSVPLKMQPMEDLSRALRLLRRNSAEYGIHPEKIAVCGFSAGGHLCASICTHFDDITEKNLKYSEFSNRPDAAILSYPVITSGEYTHMDSIRALLGWEQTAEELEYFSLEKQVKDTTPPCFVWGTEEDGFVPAENGYLFVKALREHKVPFAHYVFPYGGHGLSLANEAFFTGQCGGEYTFEQLNLALEQVKNRTAVNVSEKRHDELMVQFYGVTEPENREQEDTASQQAQEENSSSQGEQETAQKMQIPSFPDVKLWPELASYWLAKVFS